MEYTEEQMADAAARAEAFKNDFDVMYKALKDKHLCELVYGVSTVPSPSGVFGLGVTENVGDLKYKPVNAQPSPDAPLIAA